MRRIFIQFLKSMWLNIFCWKQCNLVIFIRLDEFCINFFFYGKHHFFRYIDIEIYAQFLKSMQLKKKFGVKIIIL